MTAPIPPATPEPDAKDWTWSTSRPCADCGFDPGAETPVAFPARIEDLASRVVVALDRPDAADRPESTIWSPIEYAHHLADVCEVMARRLDAMLETDGVAFESWDGDAAAVEGEYWRASAHVTSILLRERAEGAANSFAAVEPDQWSRRGIRSDGVEFTAESLGLYLLHELQHHAHDVGA
ncbi:hypothetical protein BW730_17340 [Tessaracoccus aquimaris]|uniref:DinB-like domain-containing protein n=1 Tax=Tessaracoccus aquimaris TaxID=1332264 RepID=A0A1Q2CS84_9ACTN|nr:DinB family protein [Tessaracoccus aquimaris]AQP48998.1 hypothetical protein BW730_17340 [Tessaracoccus aquimaris]